MSQHTGQESSSGDTFREAIFTVCAPAIKTLPSLSERWFQKRTTTRIPNIGCVQKQT